MKKLYWSLLACLLTGVTHAQDFAKGTVFIDLNGNGQKDKKEIGLEGVGVSNGREVVRTDKNGKYSLPVGDDNIIFVIKPQGYKLALNEFNFPKFYYIHKPQGSPKLKYEGVAPTGPLPKSIDFGLSPTQEPSSFSAFVFGDPQAYNQDELDYFLNGVIKDAKQRKGPLFGISLGDLVGDKLSLHEGYKNVIAQMDLPWYNVMGNHDENYDVEQDSLADESFERAFGPNTYSFNVSNAHFIILDDIIYPHPKTGKGYQGGFRKDQLDFIANDLKLVPKDKLIVLAFHIPLNPGNGGSFRNEDRQVLFDLLADYPNTLSLSAHTHYQQQNFYTAEHGWKGAKPHHEYNVGTTSGDWYSGEANSEGIPSSTMRDGTPKGYAILSINGNQYSFDYKVAGKEDSYKMEIFGPSILKEKHVHRYSIYANFFIGSKNDNIRYRIDGKKWNQMQRVDKADPSYLQKLLAFDSATTLENGRRPSDPVNSAHLWKLSLPKLKAGKHSIEIEAEDMFGRVHSVTKAIEVVK